MAPGSTRVTPRCTARSTHTVLSWLAAFASAQSQPFVPSEDKEARGAQLQETLKAAGPVKGGPDQVWATCFLRPPTAHFCLKTAHCLFL